MAVQDHRRGRASIIAGREDAPRKILVFHGYTGSPGEFEEMPEVLAERLDARIYIPLMPGHGTRVEDLLEFSFGDFLSFARKEANAFLDERPFALGGNSFGSYLAAHIAAERAPSALFLSATPYRFRPPFSLPGATILARMKPLWKKYIVEKERKARGGEFFYDYMPGKGLFLAKQGNAHMPDVLSRVTCPLLALHELWDPLAYPEGSHELIALSKSSVKETAFFDEGWHGLFYGEVRHKSIDTVAKFLARAFNIAS